MAKIMTLMTFLIKKNVMGSGYEPLNQAGKIFENKEVHIM